MLNCRHLFRSLLLGALAIVLAFPPAGAIAQQEAPAAQKRPRIGIAMPSFRESRWQYDLQALQVQADMNAVDILVRFAGNNQKQQNIQMKELVNIGIDILVVSAADVFGAADGIKYAKQRGVRVLCYDRLAENCEVDAYVAFERFGVGEKMGRFLVEKAPSGNYIILRGPASDSNAQEFYNGAMKYIEPRMRSGDITVLLEAEVAGWRADVAEKLVEDVLKKNPKVAAVLAPNDDTAGGVATALERYGLAGKVPITGQDANAGGLSRINQGLQSMTVFKDTTLLAQKAMDVALGLIRGEPGAPDVFIANGAGQVPTFFLPVNFVDKNYLYWLLRLPEFR